MVKQYISIGLVSLALAFSSCKKTNEVDNSYSVPTTYEFKDKEGVSTVSFSGQVERRNQLSELKAYMEKRNADKSASVPAVDLLKMYSNEDAAKGSAKNAGGLFSFSSEKQLKDKTALGNLEVQTIVESWFSDFETADSNVIRKSNSKSILISAKGNEHVQFVEKGLMGAVFYSQAMDNYLDIENLLKDDNTTLVSGKNYTDREHHFDEGFGYFGASVDYPTSAGSFYAKYATSQGVGQKIMDAFVKGRAAITNKDDATLKTQVEIIRTEWEKIIAKQAIIYLGDCITKFGEDPRGDYYHALSEAYAFIWSLNFNKQSKVSTTKVKELLNIIGDDFTKTTQENLKKAKDELIAVYGEI